MNFGSLAKNRCFLDFYPTAEHVNRGIPDDDGIPIGSLLTIISPPNGTWIKVIHGEKIGWVNWYYLEEIWDECG
jgi:hypothetical protein